MATFRVHVLSGQRRSSDRTSTGSSVRCRSPRSQTRCSPRRATAAGATPPSTSRDSSPAWSGSPPHTSTTSSPANSPSTASTCVRLNVPPFSFSSVSSSVRVSIFVRWVLVYAYLSAVVLTYFWLRHLQSRLLVMFLLPWPANSIFIVPTIYTLSVSRVRLPIFGGQSNFWSQFLQWVATSWRWPSRWASSPSRCASSSWTVSSSTRSSGPSTSTPPRAVPGSGIAPTHAWSSQPRPWGQCLAQMLRYPCCGHMV